MAKKLSITVIFQRAEKHVEEAERLYPLWKEAIGRKRGSLNIRISSQCGRADALLMRIVGASAPRQYPEATRADRVRVNRLYERIGAIDLRK